MGEYNERFGMCRKYAGVEAYHLRRIKAARFSFAVYYVS